MFKKQKNEQKTLNSLMVTFVVLMVFVGCGVKSVSAGDADPEVVDREAKTIDLLSQIDAFAEKDDRLRMDAARAHYNMGNIYYEKGQFEISAREYYQAVTLMPDDPDSHYNLAFVSAEHLEDHKTALKHYRMYLYLKPDAKDAYLIKEKIVTSQLKLRSIVDSPLEKDME